MNKLKKIIIALCAVVFVAGVILFFSPEYIEYKFDKNTRIIEKSFSEQCQEARKNRDSPEAEDKYSALYQAMVKYNRELYESGQARLVNEYSYEKPDFLLADYGIDNGEVLGMIEIPDVEIKLPVLNGANYENMINGAVYLANTSLPIGGENTNCVIAAHNQWHGVYMFMRISELQKGDMIYITNFWETLPYSVVDTKIIEPDDSNEILIKQGKDMITLSTCFYTNTGKKRYLVLAEHKTS